MNDQTIQVIDPDIEEIESSISSEVQFVNGESNQFMPALSLVEAGERYKALLKFTQERMIPGKDYGSFGGVRKDTLLKPGAEKLISFFGFRTIFVDDSVIERWDDDDPLFYYRQTCQLWRGHVLITAAGGSANSKESKHRWRWVQEQALSQNMIIDELVTRGGKKQEFAFAVEESKTEGDYSKPAAYWQTWKDAIESGAAVSVTKLTRKGASYPAWEMENKEYRIPNEDIFSLTNTVLKMAQKRAMVAAVLIGCNASEFYTQDIEDLEYYEEQYDQIAPPAKIEKTPIRTQAKATKDNIKANSVQYPRPPASPAPKPKQKKDDDIVVLANKYKGGHAITKSDYFTLAYGYYKVKDASLVKQIIKDYDDFDNFAPAIVALKTHIPPEVNS